jgi:hypothetical protein
VDREISSFKLPFDLYTFLQRFHPDRLSNISNGRLAFSMADLFKPVLDAIEQEIKAVLHDKELASCDYMFLVGGLSESPLLEKRIRGAFEGKVKKIVFPEKPSAAVVDGAALFGMDPSVVRSRKSRLTYGAASLEVFEDGRDPESRKVIGERGPRCKGRFAIYVVAGQSIEHDQPVPMVFKPLESSQDGMHFDLYATADTSPRYVDDPGSQLIGSFDVAMPDLTGGLDRKVNMVMYFGQTEIRAKATDLTSNRSSEIGNIEFHYFF